MDKVEIDRRHSKPEPLPDNIGSTQPGGGTCYRIELAWGRLRRWCLCTFRPAYVRRMAQLRRGSLAGAPHEIIDPRDLKFCRNLCAAYWREQDDPFLWRGRLPLARWGYAELQMIGGTSLVVVILLVVFLPEAYKAFSVVPAAVLGLVVYFFRDPVRQVPVEHGGLVAPADGTIVEIALMDHEAFVGGPAVRIGIFLSIFNVHVNRSPSDAEVIRLDYRPGKFLNAMRPESALHNETMWIGMRERAEPYRRLVVKQISGLIARRIVCDLRPGQAVDRGEKFGMIKFGSRTELIVPAEGLAVGVACGARVKAGLTVLAEYPGLKDGSE